MVLQYGMLRRKETLRGPGGLLIKLDASEIFPDDPGNGTPAMVCKPFGGATSTFWCACDTGEIDGEEMTNAQKTWLDAQEHAVNQWVEIRSEAIRRDGRETVLATLV